MIEILIAVIQTAQEDMSPQMVVALCSGLAAVIGAIGVIYINRAKIAADEAKATAAETKKIADETAAHIGVSNGNGSIAVMSEKILGYVIDIKDNQLEHERRDDERFVEQREISNHHAQLISDHAAIIRSLTSRLHGIKEVTDDTNATVHSQDQEPK